MNEDDEDSVKNKRKYGQNGYGGSPEFYKTSNRDGYGLDYEGSGIRCPECEHVGTYLTCSHCGSVISNE